MIDRLKTMVDQIRPGAERDAIASMFLESESNGFLPFNTASIRVKAFYDSSKSERIGNVSYKWFREFEGRNYAIDNIEEFHNVSCEDIGSKITVIVNDNDRPGVHASLSFGPIILDPQVRTELETSLNAGRATFEVQYPYKSIGNEALTKPSMIKNAEQIVIDELLITESSVSFVHSKGNSSTFGLNTLKIEPLENFPLVVKVRVEEFHKDLDFFEVRNDENQPYFYIKFFNRVFREHFLLLSKLFREVKLLPYITAIEELKKKSGQKSIFSVKLSNVLTGNQTMGDLLIQSGILKETLHRNVAYTKSVLEEKDALTTYCQSLENDLHATLKELKNLVEKKNLHEHVDLSRMKKLEKSMMEAERDRSRNFQQLVPESFRNVRTEKMRDDFERMKEDNQKLQKLNKMLMKELNNHREKKKEKIRVINQSLHNLQREVEGQAAQLEHVNQSMDVSKYLDNFQNVSVQKRPTQNFLDELKVAGGLSFRDFKKPSIRELPGAGNQAPPGPNLEDFLQERKRLETKVTELSAEIATLKKNIVDQPEQESVFREVTAKVNQTVESELGLIKQDVQSLIDELSKNVPHVEGEIDKHHPQLRILEAKNKLLAIENSFLQGLVAAVVQILKDEQAAPSLTVSQTLEMKTANRLLDEFRSTVHSLNEEVEELRKDLGRPAPEEFIEENPLVKQNLIMKSEIEKLRNENDAIRVRTLESLEADTSKKVDAVVAEKDRIIQALTTSNANLAAEIQNLQHSLNSQAQG